MFIPDTSTTGFIFVYPVERTGAKMNEDKIRRLNIVCNLTSLLGLIDVALLLTWMIRFQNGYHWKNPADRFNFHPTLMIIGFIYVHGQAILVYRRLRGFRKTTLKVFHAFFHAAIITALVFAVKAVFDTHDFSVPRIKNVYSMHSWMGLGTIGLYLSQFVLGGIIFVAPGLANHFKAFYHPVHTKLGSAIFLCTIVTALMGLAEFTTFGIKNYSMFTPESILVNCMGIILVIYGALILFLVNHEDFKRLPLEEEQPLLAAREDNHS